MSTNSQEILPAPVPYQVSYEATEPGEAETERELIDTMTRIQETTYAHGHHALRSVHAKSHGILRGEFHVRADLPPELAQGLFANAGKYPLVMRFSTNPGDLLDDNVSTPRGLAVKILGVPGARLRGTEDDVTQDFVMVNGPAFLKKDGKSFLSSLKLVAATTDRAPGLKKALSAVLRGTESLIESAGGQSATLVNLGGQLETHILGETFYSTTPYLYGKYMAKFSIAPASDELLALTKAPLDLKDKPNGLRAAVLAFFAERGAEWELRAQLCTDLKEMPVENPKVVWPESLSPYRTIARLVIPPQLAWSEARAKVVDDGYSFTPWHGIAAHRPLGSINRLRKRAYEASRTFRMKRNESPLDEPRDLSRFPET
jgi:hypothetical protein